jgi:Lon protease-like protein
VLWLVGLERFRIVEELVVDTAYRQVKVRYLPVSDAAEQVAMVQPLRQELRNLLPGVMEADDETRDGMVEQLATVTDSQLVAIAAQILELPFERKQQVLEATTLADRFVMVCEDLYARMTDSGSSDEEDPALLN